MNDSAVNRSGLAGFAGWKAIADVDADRVPGMGLKVSQLASLYYEASTDSKLSVLIRGWACALVNEYLSDRRLFVSVYYDGRIKCDKYSEDVRRLLGIAFRDKN